MATDTNLSPWLWEQGGQKWGMDPRISDATIEQWEKDAINALSNSENEKGVVAYIQVKDLSNKKDDKVFVFNGWTFSSSVTLRTFDHPVYDLWISNCENI